ncbi:MAG: hypothetical protein WCA23_20625, partial [Stellaceae bacterium]
SDDQVEIDNEGRGLGGLLGKKTGDPLAHEAGYPYCEAAKRNRWRWTTTKTSPRASHRAQRRFSERETETNTGSASSRPPGRNFAD